MKKILFFACFLLHLGAFAQIRFKENPDSIPSKANVFVYFYNEYEYDFLYDPTVIDFLNQNFDCYKVDMRNQKCQKILKKFDVQNGFEFLISTNNKEWHKLRIFQDDLVAEIKNLETISLEKRKKLAMKHHSPIPTLEYLAMLRLNQQNTDTVIQNFYDRLPANKKFEKENLNILEHFTQHTNLPVFEELRQKALLSSVQELRTLRKYEGSRMPASRVYLQFWDSLLWEYVEKHQHDKKVVWEIIDLLTNFKSPLAEEFMKNKEYYTKFSKKDSWKKSLPTAKEQGKNTIRCIPPEKEDYQGKIEFIAQTYIFYNYGFDEQYDSAILSQYDADKAYITQKTGNFKGFNGFGFSGFDVDIYLTLKDWKKYAESYFSSNSLLKGEFNIVCYSNIAHDSKYFINFVQDSTDLEKFLEVLETGIETQKKGSICPDDESKNYHNLYEIKAKILLKLGKKTEALASYAQAIRFAKQENQAVEALLAKVEELKKN